MGTDGSNDFLKLRVKDEHPGTTILDDKFQFRPSQSPVKGNKNGTNFGKGKKDFEILMTIVKKNRDPISLLNPSFQKEMTELIGA
jgi:hypothetical protein